VVSIRFDEVIRVIGRGLDLVEAEVLGVSPNHGKRIAVLAAAMGRHLGMDDAVLSDVITCGFLHDNALTEYKLLERQGAKEKPSWGLHCEYGERNVRGLPFRTGAEGFIRYHHERADGKGPFGRREGEYPLGAQLVAIADMLDSQWHLQQAAVERLPELREKIAEGRGTRFTGEAAGAMLAVLDEPMLLSLRDDRVFAAAEAAVPPWPVEAGSGALIPAAELAAHVIDYKSAFTKTHTTAIADRAWIMASHYGCDDAMKDQLYLAAALHDIGKLAIPPEVLEKPGRLDEREFGIIKRHVSHTAELLEGLSSLDAVRRWAVNHHEKLDGSGYPAGLKAEELDFNSRLIACIDIYQAISEKRPYHPERSHGETMRILYKMAEHNTIDGNIVADLDAVMAGYSGRELPSPARHDGPAKGQATGRCGPLSRWIPK
jgi:HD-GYP domain-containing protein (c-di-GMP phosphodiesterase class II)